MKTNQAIYETVRDFKGDKDFYKIHGISVDNEQVFVDVFVKDEEVIPPNRDACLYQIFVSCLRDLLEHVGVDHIVGISTEDDYPLFIGQERTKLEVILHDITDAVIEEEEGSVHVIVLPLKCLKS